MLKADEDSEKNSCYRRSFEMRSKQPAPFSSGCIAKVYLKLDSDPKESSRLAIKKETIVRMLQDI